MYGIYAFMDRATIDGPPEGGERLRVRMFRGESSRGDENNSESPLLGTLKGTSRYSERMSAMNKNLLFT